MKWFSLISIISVITTVVCWNDEEFTRHAFGVLQKEVKYPYKVIEGPHKNWLKYWSGPELKNNGELLRLELQGTYNMMENGSVIIEHKNYNQGLLFNDEFTKEIFGDLNQRQEIFGNGGINFGDHKYSDFELLEFFKLVLRENGVSEASQVENS